MTYDELLKYVEYEYASTYEDWCGNVPNSPKALLAVVKLLKNYNDEQVRVNEEFNQGILAFSNIIKEAIEKELT